MNSRKGTGGGGKEKGGECWGEEVVVKNTFRNESEICQDYNCIRWEARIFTFLRDHILASDQDGNIYTRGQIAGQEGYIGQIG